MHPNFDVARDVVLLKKAHLNGPGELPLLGPKAGGTDLHLGPIFYYLEYLWVVFFDSHSLVVLALPILFLSLAMIPLFYHLLRQFFIKPIAVLVTVIFGSSYAVTQYSRFMWNPNMIPFWGILFLLAVYKVVQTENKKIAGYWLLTAALAFGILGQLHFLAFVGFPLVAVVFWLIFRPTEINYKFWVGSLLLVLFLYSPMIINDIKYRGNNFDHFVYSIKDKSQKKERSFGQKIVKGTKETGKFTMFFVVSTNNNEIKMNNLLGVFFLGSGFLIFALADQRSSETCF